MRLLFLLATILPLLKAFVIHESASSSVPRAFDGSAALKEQSPERQLGSSSAEVEPWKESTNAISCKKVCPLAKTINNKRKHNRHIWNKAQVDGWLEVWLKAVAYERWPKRVARSIWPHQEPDIDCTSMHNRCEPLDGNCDHLCYNNTKQAPGYFFFYAAQQFHSTVITLHEFFQDLSINKILDLDEIISDWDGGSDTNSQPDVASIMSACLGIASSVTGAVPNGAVAGAALGTLSGIFSIAEAATGGDGGGGNPTVTLKDLLHKFFHSSHHLLNKLLKDVFGDGDPKDIPIKGGIAEVEGHADALFKHSAKISNFFAYGKWLFFDIDDHIDHFKKVTGERLTQALAIFAMNNKINVDGEKGYIVLINTDVSQEDCGSQNKMGYWTKGQCFNLFYFVPNTEGPAYYANVGDEWYHRFKKYKLGLKEYYDNVWECATSHAVCHHKDHRVKWVKWDGKGLPKCLFHTRLLKGSYNEGLMTDIQDPCKETHGNSFNGTTLEGIDGGRWAEL